MKSTTTKKNPILEPLPLSAIIISTAAMLAMGLYTIPYLTNPPAPQTVTRTRYQCENCGKANVFNNPILHRAQANIDNSSNFHPVITRIYQGRYHHCLETKRLILREATLNDLSTLAKYFDKIETSASSSWVAGGGTEQARKEILKLTESYRKGETAHWAICEKKSNTIIGLGGYVHYVPADHRATIGWWIDSDYWGHGYATEVGRACIEYGMKYLHLNRIDAIVRVDNVASRKVLEKIGMNYACCYRQYWQVKDELLAHYEYVVLKKSIEAQLQKSKV